MAGSMTPDRQAAFQELLTEVADGAKIVRYVNLASWLFCTYDWILNMDREIDLIWKRRFTSMTYFYLFNRYISGIILTISMFTYVQEYYIGDTFCREWWKYEAFTCTICFQVVELVLGLRVYALWKGSKVIGLIVGICFILEVLGMFIIIGIYFTHNFNATDTPFREYGIEDFHLCVPITSDTIYVYSFWFPAMAYGTLVAVLAGWKGIQRYRSDTFGGTKGQWLIGIFIRDSLIYYVLLALLELGVSILWYSGPTALVQLLVGISLAAPIVLCSKLILNIRGAYYDSNADTTDHPATGVGSSRGAEMLTFAQTIPSTTSQPLSHDKGLYSRKTANLYNDGEWAAKQFDQPSEYR